MRGGPLWRQSQRAKQAANGGADEAADSAGGGGGDGSGAAFEDRMLQQMQERRQRLHEAKEASAVAVELPRSSKRGSTGGRSEIRTPPVFRLHARKWRPPLRAVCRGCWGCRGCSVGAVGAIV